MARHAGAGAGIVDKDIDPSEGGIGRFDESIDIVPAPAMCRMGKRFASHRAYFVCNGLTGVQLAAGDDDVGAVFSEGLHHLVAEPAAAARHERHLARQIEIRAAHLATLPVSMGMFVSDFGRSILAHAASGGSAEQACREIEHDRARTGDQRVGDLRAYMFEVVAAGCERSDDRRVRDRRAVIAEHTAAEDRRQD